jgi:hypothetical protein
MTMSQEEWDAKQAAGDWTKFPDRETSRAPQGKSYNGPDFVDQALGNGQDNRAAMVERFRAQFIAGSKVLDLPEPGWVIDDIIPAGSLSLIYGPPKSGKSFIGLDMALSIATARPWAGHTVNTGPVIYTVAEGVGGLSNRVDAWLDHRDVSSVVLDDSHMALLGATATIWWLTRPINLTDRFEIDLFLEVATAIEPAAIFFDTLARCSLGAEENSAKDMGKVVAGIDLIRYATNAAVIPIHHAGKDITKGARGSSALLGAADAVYEVTGGDGMVHMRCTAMKDAEPPRNAAFKMTPTGDSIALDAYDPGTVAPSSVWDVRDALADIDTGDGIAASVWQAAADDVSRASFYRAKKWLIDGGHVITVGTTNRPRFSVPARETNDPA